VHYRLLARRLPLRQNGAVRMLPEVLREPNVAFCMVVAGLLIAYLEFLRPGSVFFGVAGAVVTMVGAAVLYESGLRTGAVWTCLLAIGLILAAVRAHLPVWTWVIPAALLLWGVSRLPAGPGFRWWITLPTTVVWLVVTLSLLRIAEIARANKSRVLPVIDP